MIFAASIESGQSLKVYKLKKVIEQRKGALLL